jgi:hypothetical protein
MFKFSRLLLLAAALTFFPHSASAQCPSPSPIPPPSPNWLDGGCQVVQVSGTCYAKVCYCVRYIGSNETQYLIKSVTPTSHDCDGMDPAVLIHQAVDAFENQMTNVSPSELEGYPCGGQSYVVKTFAVATCWQLPSTNLYDPWGVQYGSYSDGGYSPLVPCWGNTAWCMKTCNICLNGTTVSISCTNSLYGTGCSDIAESTTWLRDHCYFLGTCDW